MLRITTSHSAEGAKKYFDVSPKTSDYYTRDIGTWGGIPRLERPGRTCRSGNAKRSHAAKRFRRKCTGFH